MTHDEHNKGKFTQNYPTERKDYPSKLAKEFEQGNVSIQQRNQMRTDTLPFSRSGGHDLPDLDLESWDDNDYPQAA